MECLVNENQLYEYLEQLDQFDETTRPLHVFRFADTDYMLHVDVNEQKDLGYVYEWWVEGPDGYVDGGFEPANGDEEIRALAQLVLKSVHGCMEKVGG